MQIDCKKIESKNGNWSIDADGNLNLKGNLIVKGGLDPTFFTCVNQESDTGVANSLIVISNNLYFKNSSGSLQLVQMGSVSSDPMAGANATNNTDTALSTSNTTIATVSAPSEGTHMIVFGGSTWRSTAAQGPQFTLGGTILSVCETSGSTSNNSSGFAGIFVRNSATAILQGLLAENVSVTTYGASVAILKCNTA